MGRPNSYTAKEVVNAIKGTGGVKVAIARKLGVTRQTVASYIDRWSTVRDAYEEEKSGVDDVARSVVINDIVRNRSVDTAKWWLRMKVSDEFNEKQQIDHNVNTPISYIIENRNAENEA